MTNKAKVNSGRLIEAQLSEPGIKTLMGMEDHGRNYVYSSDNKPSLSQQQFFTNIEQEHLNWSVADSPTLPIL